FSTTDDPSPRTRSTVQIDWSSATTAVQSKPSAPATSTCACTLLVCGLIPKSPLVSAARLLTQTVPAPNDTSDGPGWVGSVATTLFVCGSIRSSVESVRSVTHTAPGLTATDPPSAPASTVATTLFVCGSTRATSPDVTVATQIAPWPMAT